MGIEILCTALVITAYLVGYIRGKKEGHNVMVDLNKKHMQG